MTRPPAWLEAFQRDFGQLLRDPLDPSSGTFRSRPDQYREELVSEVRGENAVERLQLYHEQVWMRFFDALQSSAPRVTSAMGPWAFNHLAAAHLQDHPPTGHDLERAADGLLERIAASMAHRPDVVEAAHADRAARMCFHAPYVPPWRPDADTLGGLANAALIVAPSVQLAAIDDQVWVWCRTPDGVAVRRVDPLFALLLTEAGRRPLSEALATVAGALGDAERTRFEAGLRGFIGQALAYGWWVGLRLDPSTSTSAAHPPPDDPD
ncbi:MAG: DNA-binding domain-containing protein [Myxococcota bacterium]